MSDILPPIGLPIPSLSGPDPKETDAMKKLLMALDNVATPGLHEIPVVAEPQNLNQSSNNADILAMKKILEKLDSTTEVATKKLMEDAQEDPELHEALTTEVTRGGLKIGSYRINSRLLEGTSKTKTYDIINAYGDMIADQILVYEAAYSIVKLLNQGKNFKDSTIRKLLELEDYYVNHRDSALRAKKLHKSSIANGDHNRAGIFETKFETAREKALEVKDQIIALSRNL